jgi:peptidyl-prolyl cis-trans isomerase SurA
MLAQRIVAREIRSQVEVTTDQAQKYFDEHKDELPQRPEEVHIAHILVVPQAGEQAGGPLGEIKAARARIEGGESFAEVAEDVSDDPSRTRGGVLGWFRPGDLDPDFEAAVGALEVGELSEPVRTRFGFHLIEVMDRDGERFEVRHILKLVELGDDAVAAAQERAEEARELVVAGEPFEDVAARMSDDELTRDTGGDLGWTPVASLMPAVSSMVDSLGVNGLSPVITSERGFHVFKILDRRTGGAYEFDEISDQLKSLLEQQELEEAYDEWMSAVRDSAYVEIKTW